MKIQKNSNSEEIKKVIEELKLANKEIPIIVEGGKDEKALRKIGFEGKIIKLNKGKSIPIFCEEIAKSFKEVIILTDWDFKGGELSKLLKNCFKANSVKVDTKFRTKISSLCKKDIKDVQSLGKHLKLWEFLIYFH